MGKKIAIFAYMKNNLGDDIFVKLLCDRYPDSQFYIAELDFPNKTLDSINNLHYSKKMKEFEGELGGEVISNRLKKYFSRFDACVFIGGSVFMQPSRNWRAQIQRNKNRMEISSKFFIIGANFGPYQDQGFLDSYNKIFSHIEDICFRDTNSASHFPNITSVRFAPDVIFSCPVNIQESIPQVLISIIDCTWRGRPQFQYLSRHQKIYEDKIIEMCSAFFKRGYKVCLAPFCVAQGDEAAAHRIMDQCLKNGVTGIKIKSYTGNISDMLNEISISKFVLATRFHAMILGWRCRKPTYPIIYDKKQEMVIRDLGFCGAYCQIDRLRNIDVENLFKALSNYAPFDCSKYICEAETQFSALDKFINDK